MYIYNKEMRTIYNTDDKAFIECVETDYDGVSIISYQERNNDDYLILGATFEEDAEDTMDNIYEQLSDPSSRGIEVPYSEAYKNVLEYYKNKEEKLTGDIPDKKGKKKLS